MHLHFLRSLHLSSPLVAALALAVLSLGCRGENVPAGRILVKNDSQDRDYNVITVSGGGSYASLKPGERFLLPHGVRSFSVQRRYRDYTRAYTVTCPPLGDRGVSMRLIDIHVNRMPGGCKTTEASKQ
jgi:guanyl-specific ribonuclease Sa